MKGNQRKAHLKKKILCFTKLLALGFFQHSTFKMDYYKSVYYDDCVAYVET